MFAALLLAVTISGRLPAAIPALSAGGQPCAVEGLRWACSVEPGDVRLEPQGFAPVYLFGISADRDAGLLPLHVGASVSGFVSAPHAKVQLGQHAVEANERGFYQFLSVAPGLYDLVAAAPPRRRDRPRASAGSAPHSHASTRSGC